MFRISQCLMSASLLVVAATLALPVRALQSERHAAHRRTAAPCKEILVPSPGEKIPGDAAMSSDELRFLDLVNRERATRHLAELKPDPLLVQVARGHSREMWEKNYFDHFSPTPGERTPMDRYLHAVRARPAHACVGENLFYCSVVDVERGHRALMNSPGHRANILYPPFRRSGIGIYKSDSGEFWVTEMFLTTEG
jgi:uncharacterized protein YkwD